MRTTTLTFGEKSDDLINFWCLTPLSTISWRPVLVVDEARVSGENLRPWASNKSVKGVSLKKLLKGRLLYFIICEIDH
jgi:hypothetical protein